MLRMFAFYLHANSFGHGLRRRRKSLQAMNISLLRRYPATKCNPTMLRMCAFFFPTRILVQARLRRRRKSLQATNISLRRRYPATDNNPTMLRMCAFFFSPQTCASTVAGKRKKQPYGLRRIAFWWRRRRDSNS